MAPLVACPHCNVHAILSEKVCPHCGMTIRRSDGSIPMTAAAVILGLTVAAASCGGDSAPEYGVAATGSDTATSASSAGQGGGNAGGAGGADITPEYGVAATGGAGGEGGAAGGADPVPEYGVAGSGA